MAIRQAKGGYSLKCSSGRTIKAKTRKGVVKKLRAMKYYSKGK